MKYNNENGRDITAGVSGGQKVFPITCIDCKNYLGWDIAFDFIGTCKGVCKTCKMYSNFERKNN